MGGRLLSRWALLAVPAVVVLVGLTAAAVRRRGRGVAAPEELTGAAELVVMQFPGRIPGRAVARRLAQLGRDHQLRIVDVAFLHKDEDGSVETFELPERAGQREFEALDRAVPEIDAFIAEEDLVAIACQVAPGNTAGAFLIRHEWLDDLASAVERRGGELVMVEHLTPAEHPAAAAVGV